MGGGGGSGNIITVSLRQPCENKPLGPFILEKSQMPHAPVLVKGTFDSGPQGDFCTRELCRQLQRQKIAFHPLPKPEEQVTWEDILEKLREELRSLHFAKHFDRANKFTSIGNFDAPNKTDCGLVCRYDIGRGGRESCPGLVIRDPAHQHQFLKLGGVLFERDRLRRLQMAPTSETTYRCEEGWFYKPSKRFAELGIKFTRSDSLLIVDDEASLCACALSGAKMPNIQPLLDRHGCDIQKLG